MLRTAALSLLTLALPLTLSGQPAVQSPYSSNYTVVSIGPTPAGRGAALTFLNASTLLITGGESTATIYQVPVTRSANGQITSQGAAAPYASVGEADLDAGLAFGPGGVLFARAYDGTMYEFKPGSTSPDLITGVIDGFGTLAFVPAGLAGAGELKWPVWGPSWYDVTLAANGSGTYNVTGETGPYAPDANSDPFGVFYVPLGSPQFTSPSILVGQSYSGPIWAYSVDSDGNPSGSGTPFVAGTFYPYGAAFDPISGDMLFTNYDDGNVYAVQGFTPGSLTVSAGSPQSSIVKTAFESPLTVRLSDPYGDPVDGVTVTFAAPASGASATLSANSAVTGSDGTATVTAKANATSGSYTVTATVYGFSAGFSLTNVALSALTLSPASVTGGNSSSANTVTLTSAAPAGGATITLSSSNTAVATVPASVTVTGGQTVSAPFSIATTAVSSTEHVTIKASDGTNTKSSTLTVKPAALTAVKLSPKSATGGKSTTGNTVTLNGPAAPAGAVVALSSSDPTVAAVPASVTVASGSSTSPAFTITTTAVAEQTAVTISANYDGVTKTANLTVNAPVLSSLKLSPASVTGGHSTTRNKVTLNGVAPAGGATVMLTSGDASVASPPTTVTVPEGSTSADFTITTTAVSSSTQVSITATFGGVTKSANLTVNP